MVVGRKVGPTCALIATPLGESLLCQNGVAAQELVELAAEGKARAADANVLFQTEVAHLMHAPVRISFVNECKYLQIQINKRIFAGKNSVRSRV